MPEIDVVDMTWIDVRPASLAPIMADPANWKRWWPDLRLQVDELRGPKGVRWLVPSGRNGTVTGSMEIWLQPVGAGTVVHFFLRLDGTRGRVGPRERDRIAHGYRVAVKRVLWGVADRVDPARLARIAGPRSAVP
jgi:hypothetical protein